MNGSLEELVTLLSPSDPLFRIVEAMGRKTSHLFEVALVVDDSSRLLGIINYADVLRALASGKSMDTPAHEAMTVKPVVALLGMGDREIIQHVRTQVRVQSGGSKELTRFVPLVDSSNVVHDIVDVFKLLTRATDRTESVEIFGLGFVGLTLAVALASRGHQVMGFDNDEELVRQLLRGEPRIHEPRLGDMMRRLMNDGLLNFLAEPDDRHRRVVIVSVGTPVRDDGSVALDALESAVASVGQRLRRGDLVMLRSTVPVGTTRSVVRETLERVSGIKAGKDFSLAFTPERTVEGRAMQELLSLPQIVGGLSNHCADQATTFWQTLTPSIVRVEGLEAAELVKLANNSFRDLSFGFANAFALLSDSFNLDATRILKAANEGYPRNPIPLPGPGVGGYCLTKDPMLYAANESTSGHARLARIGREVNLAAGRYPIQVLDRFAQLTGRSLRDLYVFICGLAFKGQPETNDLRGSVAVEVGRFLISMGCRVGVFDAVVSPELVKNQGFEFENLSHGAANCDAMLILNNHPLNVHDGMIAKLSGRRTLLFDGWSLLDSSEVERYGGIMYANMGYSTPAKDWMI